MQFLPHSSPNPSPETLGLQASCLNGKGLFLILQIPNSIKKIKNKKMNTELGQGPIPSSSV